MLDRGPECGADCACTVGASVNEIGSKFGGAESGNRGEKHDIGDFGLDGWLLKHVTGTVAGGVGRRGGRVGACGGACL